MDFFKNDCYRLAIDIVEGEEYLGASALHLAIAYNNNEVVQDLIEAGAVITQRATGSFFQPKDQQRMRPARNTDYEGLAYLGEYPLAWAACCANESVYNLLLELGADPDVQDSYGNMILHMVVVCDKLVNSHFRNLNSHDPIHHQMIYSSSMLRQCMFLVRNKNVMTFTFESFLILIFNF